MEVRKFIRKIFFFCLWPLGLYVLAPKKFYQSQEYRTWENVFQKINNEKGLKNVVIGDSKTQYGLDADYLSALNLSLGGTTPVEGFFILNEILQRNSVDTVFFSFGPSHIFSQDCFFTRSMYYKFIDREFLGEVLLQAKEVGDSVFFPEYFTRFDSSVMAKIISLTGNPFLGARIQDLHDAFKFGPYNIIRSLAGYAQPGSQFENGYNDFHEGLSLSNDPTKVLTNESIMEKLSPSRFSELDLLFLQKSIELCKKKKIEIFFIVCPLPEKSIRPEKKYFDSYIKIIEENFGEKILMDSLFYSNRLFRDSGHLNKEGVRIFSAKVKGLLKKK